MENTVIAEVAHAIGQKSGAFIALKIHCAIYIIDFQVTFTYRI